MLYSCFTGPGTPDPATLGLTPLKLVTEYSGAVWGGTRAKMLSECAPGCVLNLEENKGGMTTRAEYAGQIVSLLSAVKSKTGSAEAYGLSRTDLYAPDPDKPLDNYDDEAKLAKRFAPYVSRVHCDAYWKFPMDKYAASPLEYVRKYMAGLVNHRKITRLIWGPDKQIVWWVMCLKDLTWEPLPQGLLENIAWDMKAFVAGGDSVCLFTGMEQWDDKVHGNFVRTFKKVIG